MGQQFLLPVQLQRECTCTGIDLYSAFFFPCFIPLLVFMVILFAFSFGLSYELCPPRTLDVPFSFLTTRVPDPCWLPDRVEKCRVALNSLHKACSVRHLVLLFFSISVFPWNVLVESGAGGRCHTAVVAACRTQWQVLTKPCKVWYPWLSEAPI